MTLLEALSDELLAFMENLSAGRASLYTQIEKLSEYVLEFEQERGWRRLLLPSQEFFSQTIQTAKKVTVQRTAHKSIIQKHKTKLVNATTHPKPVDNVEILRLLLQYEIQTKFHKKALRYQTDTKEALRLFFPYKYHAGEHKGHFVKVDLSACFYTIYSRLGVDVQVIADIDHQSRAIELKAVGRGAIRADTSVLIATLKPQKELRNAVYGLTRAAWCIWYKPHQPTAHRTFMRTPLLNLDLTVAISSALHALVAPIWDKVIYWNIDGGVIHRDALNTFVELATTHGFAVKAQDVEHFECKGLGAYALDGKPTEHFRRITQITHPVREYLYNVKNPDKLLSWLRREPCQP